MMSPMIVRLTDGTEDEYDVVSGHRRLHAAQKAGITEVPAFCAVCKMKLEALKHQGKSTDLTDKVQSEVYYPENWFSLRGDRK